jgi:hypothetical protein
MSNHADLYGEWYGGDYFERFDGSALLALGILAEEIVKEQLRSHLMVTQADFVRHRPKGTRIPELRIKNPAYYEARDPNILERIQKWKSQATDPPTPPHIRRRRRRVEDEESPSANNQ